MKRYLIGAALIAFIAAPARADEAGDMIAKLIGQLQISQAQCLGQNGSLTAQLSAAQAKLAEALKKCGTPCGSAEGDTPGETQKKLDGASLPHGGAHDITQP